MSAPVVILGAGQAGLSCAAALRAGGFDGPLTLVGAEAHPPYQRPPLSKAYLTGAQGIDGLLLRPRDWYAQMGITLRLSCRVRAIDRMARLLRLEGGGVVPYGQLVLATGCAARTLPQVLTAGRAGVFTLRSLADAGALRAALRGRMRVVIIGAGYVGLEVAAALRGLDHDVVVVEAGARPLGRVASRETAGQVAALHLARGVRLHLGRGVAALTGVGRVDGVVLDDGTRLPADLVVAGIGAAPRVALAADCGLPVRDGILVDEVGRTADPAILAAGDCAVFLLAQGPVRLESVGHAVDSGAAVAATILGRGQAYAPQPWFWSDQYDLKLQIAGVLRPDDRIVVRRAPGEGLSHWAHRDGRLVAVEALNAPRAYQVARRLIATGQTPPAQLLADPGCDLRQLMAPAQARV